MSFDNRDKKEHECKDTLARFMASLPPPVFVLDPEVDSFVSFLPALASEEATRKFAVLIDTKNLESIFSSLRAIEKTASPQAAETLVRLVAMFSRKLPRERKKNVAAAFTQAPIFVAEALRCISDEVARAASASVVISGSPSLPFACDVMNWVAGSMIRQAVFTPDTELKLQCQLADRIDRDFANDLTPIYLRDEENTSMYLKFLLKAGRDEYVRTYLTGALVSRPESICEFLWAIFPAKGESLRTGEPMLIGILPPQYDFLSRLFDPSFVAELAQVRLKALLHIAEKSNSASEWDIPHLKQFLAFYKFKPR